jgi:hypothetical protein
MAEQRPTDHGRADECAGDTNPVGLLYISDVQALQRAETVSFHTGHDMAAWIHASLTAPAFGEPRIYTATEQRLFPDADNLDRRRRIAVAADIVGYDEQRRWHERHLPGAAAFAMIGAARFDDVWRSVAAFLRIGDVIGLHWRADNNTDRLTELGLHRDELSIAVNRGKRRWMFLLDVQVRPGPARMITRARG